MLKSLTQDQVEAYHRDGYLSPIDALSASEAAEFRRALEQAEAQWPDATSGSGRNNLHLCLAFADEIVHHAGIVDAVEDILGPDILVYGTVLFAKEPHDPGFVSWHQDATYMGLEPFNGVTAWLALSPSNAASGCMRMIPGSHSGGIVRHEDTFGETNLLTRGQEIGEVDDSAAVDLMLEPGQMSFHHPSIMHSSQPNRSDDRRIGFAIQAYLQPNSKQVIGPPHAQLVRGTDSYNNFDLADRPTADMQPGPVTKWKQVNKAWEEILYHGATQRRDY
jgi:hypothetical protein